MQALDEYYQRLKQRLSMQLIDTPEQARLLEGVTWLAATVQQQLASALPLIAGQVLAQQAPQCLQAYPMMTMAQCRSLSSSVVIPAGSVFRTQQLLLRTVKAMTLSDWQLNACRMQHNICYLQLQTGCQVLTECVFHMALPDRQAKTLYYWLAQKTHQVVVKHQQRIIWQADAAVIAVFNIDSALHYFQYPIQYYGFTLQLPPQIPLNKIIDIEIHFDHLPQPLFQPKLLLHCVAMENAVATQAQPVALNAEQVIYDLLLADTTYRLLRLDQATIVDPVNQQSHDSHVQVISEQPPQIQCWSSGQGSLVCDVTVHQPQLANQLIEHAPLSVVSSYLPSIIQASCLQTVNQTIPALPVNDYYSELIAWYRSSLTSCLQLDKIKQFCQRLNWRNQVFNQQLIEGLLSVNHQITGVFLQGVCYQCIDVNVQFDQQLPLVDVYFFSGMLWQCWLQQTPQHLLLRLTVNLQQQEEWVWPATPGGKSPI